MGTIPKYNHMETFRLPLSFHEDKRARCNETAVFAVGLEMTKSARGLRGQSGAMNHMIVCVNIPYRNIELNPMLST